MEVKTYGWKLRGKLTHTDAPTDEESSDEPKSIVYERQGHFSSLDVIRTKGDLCDVIIDVSKVKSNNDLFTRVYIEVFNLYQLF